MASTSRETDFAGNIHPILTVVGTHHCSKASFLIHVVIDVERITHIKRCRSFYPEILARDRRGDMGRETLSDIPGKSNAQVLLGRQGILVLDYHHQLLLFLGIPDYCGIYDVEVGVKEQRSLRKGLEVLGGRIIDTVIPAFFLLS